MDNQSDLHQLTADIVAEFVTSNRVDAVELPAVIQAVYGALDALGKASVPAFEPEKAKPAVPVKRSVEPDAILCLFCGKPQKTLKRHIRTAHGMEEGEYRAYWGLPTSYPMVAPSYSAQRADYAKANGLGKRARGNG